jgi:hypothetical protein
MVYGATLPHIAPNYGGLVGGATAPTTPAICGTVATSSSPVGSYASSCSGAMDDNCTITYVPGTVTVTRATLRIWASSEAIYSGSTPSDITASYSGWVGGDTDATITAPGNTAPTCTTEATSSSSVGGYASTCSGAQDDNYLITYVPGSVLVITPWLSASRFCPNSAAAAWASSGRPATRRRGRSSP